MSKFLEVNPFDWLIFLLLFHLLRRYSLNFFRFFLLGYGLAASPGFLLYFMGLFFVTIEDNDLNLFWFDFLRAIESHIDGLLDAVESAIEIEVVLFIVFDSLQKFYQTLHDLLELTSFFTLAALAHNDLKEFADRC